MICSGKPTTGGRPAWGLGEGLTTHREEQAFYETLHRVSDLREIGWEGANQMHLAQDRDQ
jgi:hypothetical protein